MAGSGSCCLCCCPLSGLGSALRVLLLRTLPLLCRNGSSLSGTSGSAFRAMCKALGGLPAQRLFCCCHCCCLVAAGCFYRCRPLGLELRIPAPRRLHCRSTLLLGSLPRLPGRPLLSGGSMHGSHGLHLFQLPLALLLEVSDELVQRWRCCIAGGNIFRDVQP